MKSTKDKRKNQQFFFCLICCCRPKSEYHQHHFGYGTTSVALRLSCESEFFLVASYPNVFIKAIVSDTDSLIFVYIMPTKPPSRMPSSLKMKKKIRKFQYIISLVGLTHFMRRFIQHGKKIRANTFFHSHSADFKQSKALLICVLQHQKQLSAKTFLSSSEVMESMRN